MYLYERHKYLNKNISYLISNEIIEYDIKSAGFNLIKKYKLVDEYKINHLERLDKKQRQIQIGLYQKYNKELAQKLNEKFVEIRRWFFENNNLEDDDVLSIKKDAILTTKRCLHTKLDNIEFIEKNQYTSYYYLNKLEFYYNINSGVDVKGIDDERLELHKEYMLDFFYNFFKMQEISNKRSLIQMIMDFSYYYKNKQLNIGYYREFNVNSLFMLKDTLFGDKVGVVEPIGEFNNIEINYNYIRYILPLVSILI